MPWTGCHLLRCNTPTCYNTPKHPRSSPISDDQPPRLTKDQVLHISALARVGLSQEDVERFRDQLSRVLEHFETLAELDTEGIPATAQVGQLQNVMRSDDPAPSTPREEILANAPLKEEGCFKIRAVLEE